MTAAVLLAGRVLPHSGNPRYRPTTNNRRRAGAAFAETVFYPRGDGQPGDNGQLHADNAPPVPITATASSYWVFAELPPAAAWLGLALIVAAGIYVAAADMRAPVSPTSRAGD